MSKKMDELLEKRTEELMNELKDNMEQNKKYHDMAVLMGSLGVSPQKMESYFDSMKKIDEFNHKSK